MLSDIYNSRILELAGNLPRIGRLAAPHGSATAHSQALRLDRDGGRRAGRDGRVATSPMT